MNPYRIDDILPCIASCLVETTIAVETILLTTILLEKGLVHLPNLVIGHVSADEGLCKISSLTQIMVQIS